jgi:DNA-binding transcriptional LysR family regulator
MQHLNWDNLRYVLRVAGSGSIAAAARELGVNRTTVLRRINAFQQDLNCRIFERGDSGYVLTPEAEKMIAAAREVEATLFDMQRQIAGRELRLEGELRVTTTDSFMLAMLAPHLASFRERHPHIVVTVLITNSLLDLNRRDADIAIRPIPVPDAGLVGQRLQDVRFDAFASAEYLESASDLSLLDHRWLGFADTLRATLLGKWLESKLEPRNICLRCDSFVGLRTAAEAGIGVAMLPRFLGEESESLVRLAELDPGINTGSWILTHPDLVRSARVHAFVDHFSRALGVLETGSTQSRIES